MEAALDPELPPLAAPQDFFCSACNTRVNGPDAWVTHITGKAHRRRARLVPSTALSRHEQFEPRQAARQFL
eukprot:3498457-Lingulodinium_polyedra.AAC.1